MPATYNPITINDSTTTKNEILPNQIASASSKLASPIKILNKSRNLFFTGGINSGGEGGLESAPTTPNILEVPRPNLYLKTTLMSSENRRDSITSTRTANADERRSLLDGSMEFTV